MILVNMESPRIHMARDLAEVSEIQRLFPRDPECVQCDGSSELSCPSCPSGQECQFSIPLDNCPSECAQAVCVPIEDAPGADESNSDGSGGGGGGPNVGAIAGGVVGGVVFIAIVTYLVWRFLIKPKRAEEAQSQYGGGIEHNPYGSEKDGASGMTRRGSTHTVHSIASTVLTRASNIIQIAYIPGVTNRATTTQSGVSVPPVPPIPMQHSANRESTNEDQHFFMPGDLRDSTYSGLSGYSDRTSFARTSYAPRSSVASTIYGKQAVMAPSQTGMRLKPTMVSVKSIGTSGSGDSTPPVPTINLERFGDDRRDSSDSTPPVPTINLERFGDDRRDSSGSNFSVGSTFLNTATQARAHIVKVGSGLKKVEIGNRSDGNSSKTSSISNPHAVEKDTDEPSSGSITMMHDTGSTPSTPDQGPFSDPPETQQSTFKSVSTPTLGAVLEAEPEDEQRAASNMSQRSVPRATSPFSDVHATK